MHPTTRGTTPPAAASASPIEPATDATHTSAPDAQRRRRRVGGWLIAAAALLVLLAVIGAVFLQRSTPDVAASPSPTIIVGTAGGVVISQGDPSATPQPASVPPSPAESASPVATPESTAPTVIAATPPQPTTVPAATSAPEPTMVALAVAGPDDAVGAFYGHVVAGSFEQAYALWSDRMRATYPRQENLDQRFDETASIGFQQLYVAEQAGNNATVQANFTETYDSGSSRQFIGYWRLVRVDGVWLLDEPSY